jgi:hypothetical protein
VASSHSSGRRSRKAEKQRRSSDFFGFEEPRIWTPELRPLTPKTSLGFAAIKFAEFILGMILTPWQKWSLIHILELNPDRTFRFRTILLLIARQNGKTTLVQIINLFLMSMGEKPMTIIGTAQKLPLAERTWQETLDLAKAIPELAAEIPAKGGEVQRNGAKEFKFRNGSSYLVQTADSNGGRSISADVVFIDELRQHKSWDGWNAVSGTTTATSGMVIGVSNAGTLESVVLNELRKTMHGRPVMTEIGLVTDPDKLYKEEEVFPRPDNSMGIFEYSAEPGMDIWDRKGWKQANPSVGYTGLTEQTLISKAALVSSPLTEAGFRTESLCQQVDTIAVSPFADGVWEAGKDITSRIADDSRLVFCADTTKDRSRTYLAVAGFRADGDLHVEIVTQRDGIGWLAKWMKRWIENPDNAHLKDRLIGLVIPSNSGAPIATQLANGEFDDLDLNVIEWNSKDQTVSTGYFYDRVTATARWSEELKELAQDVAEGQMTQEAFDALVDDELHVYHLPQDSLDLAASLAVKKKLGDVFWWDRRESPVDVSPLIGVTGAVWALLNAPESEESIYESRGMIFA